MDDIAVKGNENYAIELRVPTGGGGGATSSIALILILCLALVVSPQSTCSSTS